MSIPLLPTVDRLAEPLRRFVDRLTEEQKLLLVLKRQLYDGDWQPMVTDLRNRLEGRPYVLRLAHRIEDDLRRIEQIRRMEEQYNVDLSAFVSDIRPSGA